MQPALSSPGFFPRQNLFSLLSTFLRPHFHFLLAGTPSCFAPLCQAERDLTLINKFLLPRWSTNKARTLELIFPSVMVFSVCFKSSRGRERASEQCDVLLTWVMVSLAWSLDSAHCIVCMFAAHCDNLISSCGCGATRLLNQVCQKGQKKDCRRLTNSER